MKNPKYRVVGLIEIDDTATPHDLIPIATCDPLVRWQATHRAAKKMHLRRGPAGISRADFLSANLTRLHEELDDELAQVTIRMEEALT